jgi:hypothetical protein
MKAMAMAMGREFLPPEEADSWGEFHARLEFEAADPGPLLLPVWWTAGGLLFGVGLVCCAFALQGGRWWMWLCMLVPLGVVGVMAARAVERADRRRARAAELARMHDAWLNHLERGSPTL